MRLFCILIFILSCSHASDAKINLYSKRVMDIELQTQNILPHCTVPGDPEKKNSWLGIYIFYNKRVEWLGERRQRLPEDCRKLKEVLSQLLKKSKTARVIGIESSDYLVDRDLAMLLNDPSIKSIDGSWILSRMITENGCFGVAQDCNEPRLVEKDWYSDIYE